jgi:hypothetical protein
MQLNDIHFPPEVWRGPSDHRIGADIKAYAILDNKRPAPPVLIQEALAAPQQQSGMSRQLDMESGPADRFSGANWASLKPGSIPEGNQSRMNPVLLQKDDKACFADACWRNSGSSASSGAKHEKKFRIKPCCMCCALLPSISTIIPLFFTCSRSVKGGTNRKYWPHGFMGLEGLTGSEYLLDCFFI